MGANTGLWGGQLFGGGGAVNAPSGATPNRTLIRAALRKAGVTLAPGRMPSDDQLAEAVAEESRMIGGWNNSSALIFTLSILTDANGSLLKTKTNQQSYTIGKDPTGNSTADWDVTRPQEITFANFLMPTASDSISKVRRPLRIWDDKQWGSIQFQAVYTYPEGLYFDSNCDPATGFARIYFRPIPDAEYELEFYTWQLIPTFSGLDDAVILPPGYEDAIVNNLAVRLDTMPWPVKVAMNPQVKLDAISSLAVIQGMNVRVPRLKSDPELTNDRGIYNWLTGQVEG